MCYNTTITGRYNTTTGCHDRNMTYNITITGRYSTTTLDHDQAMSSEHTVIVHMFGSFSQAWLLFVVVICVYCNYC